MIVVRIFENNLNFFCHKTRGRMMLVTYLKTAPKSYKYNTKSIIKNSSLNESKHIFEKIPGAIHITVPIGKKAISIDL